VIKTQQHASSKIQLFNVTRNSKSLLTIVGRNDGLIFLASKSFQLRVYQNNTVNVYYAGNYSELNTDTRTNDNCQTHLPTLRSSNIQSINWRIQLDEDDCDICVQNWDHQVSKCEYI